MNRPRIRHAVLCAAVLAATSCATSDAPASGGAGEKSPRAAAAADPTDIRPGSDGPGALDYAMVVPENVVYLPWKMIGGGFKGASDGVTEGFTKGTMPILGVVFAPLNLVLGFLTGFVEGTMMSPGAVGPSASFSRAMSAPMKLDTTVWWY